MNVVHRIKQSLRMCGHAFVSTVHDRLNVLERRLENIGAGLDDVRGRVDEVNRHIDSVAETEGTLLQGSIRALELFGNVNLYLEKLAESDARVTGALNALAEDLARRVGSVRGDLDVSIENASRQRSAFEQLDSRIARLEATGTAALAELRPILENEVVRQVSIDTSDYGFANPEIGLMSFLYSYLPSRRAIDIGANCGEVSDSLLRTGYEVFAFEPQPEVYRDLTGRLGEKPDFHAFPFAIGSSDEEMPLHSVSDLSGCGRYGEASAYSSLAPHSMPEDLPFTDVMDVPVRTLRGLHESGALPGDVALVKIDTEGFDLEVIRGMGERRYPVVSAEFWDPAIPFGQSGLLYTLHSLVEEMRQRSYFWYIVLYRVWGRNQTAFYCNHARSVPNSWGNVFFFKEHGVFAQAQAWCSAALPRTYFKPTPRG